MGKLLNGETIKMGRGHFKDILSTITLIIGLLQYDAPLLLDSKGSYAEYECSNHSTCIATHTIWCSIRCIKYLPTMCNLLIHFIFLFIFF